MRVPESRSNLDPSENMMTSMIDVVFLLLIFFLVVAAGRRSEAKLPVELGSGSTGGVPLAAPATTEEVWIRAASNTLAGTTTWTINETEYGTPREVRDVLKQLADLQPDMPVILDIGPEVPAGDLVEVYDACRAAGLEAINFNLKKVSDE